MELTLRPNNKNSFEIGAVLINDPSPKVWLQEIQAMHLSLNSVQAYAIPSDKANVLYGCLVVLGNQKVDNIGKNQYLQCIDNKLFIPEYATVYPLVATEEWEMLLPDFNYVYLPQIGLYKLNDAIYWSNLILPVARQANRVKSPGNTVFIPDSIKSLRVEYDEEDLLKELEKPFSEEEAIEKLPFDMKKLLNGNQKEMEKYLEFMDKHPEMAMKYAIPLDTLNTSRGDNQGKFSFGGSSFFSDFFGSGSGGSSPIKSFLTSKAVIAFCTTIFLIFLFSTLFSSPRRSYSEPTSQTNKVINQMPVEEVVSANKIILASFIVIIAMIVLKLVFTSKLSIARQASFRSAVILSLLLLAALYLLLSPIYYHEGFDRFFTLLILVAVVIILYRVLDSGKTLLKRDNEK